MKREEMAFQLFLKKLPSGHVNESTLPGYRAAAREALELADVFLEEAAKETKAPAVKAPEDTY